MKDIYHERGVDYSVHVQYMHFPDRANMTRVVPSSIHYVLSVILAVPHYHLHPLQLTFKVFVAKQQTTKIVHNSLGLTAFLTYKK